MNIRIYQPGKTATQSGKANALEWLLEYAPQQKKWHDPLLGWVASGDTRQQVTLHFQSLDEAIEFARKIGQPYTIIPAPPAAMRFKSYADNFGYRRKKAWTH